MVIGCRCYAWARTRMTSKLGQERTLLSWLDQGIRLDVHWCVLSGTDERGTRSKGVRDRFSSGSCGSHNRDHELSRRLLSGARRADQGLVRSIEGPRQSRCNPHPSTETMRIRTIARSARLVWNTFRDHLVLEYEIPKWDGDMARPNLYVPVSASAMQRKVDLLISHFGSQRSKQWFDAETFLGLARLRGMECRAQRALCGSVCRAQTLAGLIGCGAPMSRSLPF